MIYPRSIRKEILQEINSHFIIVLTGMRQVGKTTLMRDVFSCVKSRNKIFLDLENPLNRKVFEEKNFDNIIINLKQFGLNAKERMYVFLDEIQLMAEISQAIKYLYDHYQIKFFLTGSSSYYLKNLFPESLSGRKILFELFPLEFEEFLEFNGIKKGFIAGFSKKADNKSVISYEKYNKLYEEYLKWGGFPGVVLEPNTLRKNKIIEDIFTSYFEKDVKNLADFRNIRQFRDMILLLAKRAGSKVEITKISSEIGIARETVYSYLGFLEHTYFISLISPFSRNIDREVRSSKKIYFCDSGILNFLGASDQGVVLENAVFNNLRRFKKINYFQRYTGAEIDFIVDGAAALEAKISGTLNDIKKLQRISNSLGIKEYYLVCKNFLNHQNVIMAQDL